MFGNVLTFIAIIAVLIGLILLTARAWRIRPLALRIPIVFLSGLLTLALLAFTVVAGKGLAFAIIPPAPVPDMVVEGTPEQVARGEYLVDIACTACHGADGTGDFPLTGGLEFSAEVPPIAGKIVSSNITPGGVLAERTDGELFRILRYGYGENERLGMMSFVAIRELSDDDLKAIIAYLRTQESVTTASNGGDQVNLLGNAMFFGLDLIPMPETNHSVITTPPAGVNVEYGRYMATLGDCRACHGPDMTGTETTPLGPGNPNPRPFVSKITQEEFIQTMRTGIRPNGIELQMPWENAAKMTDEDLAALYLYLKAQP